MMKSGFLSECTYTNWYGKAKLMLSEWGLAILTAEFLSILPHVKQDQLMYNRWRSDKLTHFCSDKLICSFSEVTKTQEIRTYRFWKR
ncbi:MAG: hypothetical protein HQM08_27930 [Candidatus Riflebacteria bacterium]|nr:hypothetical protein [Candidatus Riflebacteria bacterium]